MDDQENLKFRKRTKLFQTIVIGVNTLLGRWSHASHSSAGILGQVDATVEDVIKETEAAVARFGESFRSIMKKTRRQTELATGLLKHRGTENSDAQNDLGLQDYIRMYEERLREVTQQLEHYSGLAQEMVEHQQRVRQDAVAMDDVLDEIRTMSARISKISLDASVAAVNQDFGPANFIELADKVRSISEQSHDLTRRARQSLDSIRSVVGVATKSTFKAAELSRAAAAKAAVEIEKLNAGMAGMGSEIETTLLGINELGGEIQRDINHVIVAMQFQDLTQQKLEKVRHSNLNSVRESLAGLSHETRALMQRDLYRAILSYSESSVRPSEAHAALAADESAVEKTDLPAPAGDKETARKNVELF